MVLCTWSRARAPRAAAVLRLGRVGLLAKILKNGEGERWTAWTSMQTNAYHTKAALSCTPTCHLWGLGAVVVRESEK